MAESLTSQSWIIVTLFSTCFHNANRPSQGYRRHIAGGAKTLGRARGQLWRPLYFPMSDRKLHLGICSIVFQNIDQIFWVIPGFFFMCDQDFTLIKGSEVIENRSDLCTPRSAFKRCVCINIYKQTTLVTMAITKCIKIKVTRLLMDNYSLEDHLNKQSNKMDPKEKTKCYHKYGLIERRIAQKPIELCKEHCGFLSLRVL